MQPRSQSRRSRTGHDCPPPVGRSGRRWPGFADPIGSPLQPVAAHPGAVDEEPPFDVPLPGKAIAGGGPGQVMGHPAGADRRAAGADRGSGLLVRGVHRVGASGPAVDDQRGRRERLPPQHLPGGSGGGVRCLLPVVVLDAPGRRGHHRDRGPAGRAGPDDVRRGHPGMWVDRVRPVEGAAGGDLGRHRQTDPGGVRGRRGRAARLRGDHGRRPHRRCCAADLGVLDHRNGGGCAGGRRRRRGSGCARRRQRPPPPRRR